MGDSHSRHGPCWGHDGSGPGYAAAAYHLPQHPAGAVTCVLLCGSEVPDVGQRVFERPAATPGTATAAVGSTRNKKWSSHGDL